MKKLVKLLSLLICVAVILSSISVPSFADEIFWGDINGNGKIDTQDAREILKMASGIIFADIMTADMNSDGAVNSDDVIEALKNATGLSSVEIPDKNGDNKLSDSPDNEFVNLISETYGVDKSVLVAIYSVPDSGTNYVLQFKKGFLGLVDKRSPDDLVKVYHIGTLPERKISYTDGNLTGGDHYNCSAAEGYLVFNLVKTKVMPQYPTYFDGV